MTKQLQPFDDGPALAEARWWVARCLEPGFLASGGLAALHPQAGHAYLRNLFKHMAMGHPLSATTVCQLARAGSDDADRALCELIAEITERGEPLPSVLRAYSYEILNARRAPPRFKGQKKAKHIVQDVAITMIVREVASRHGLTPTRRPATTKPSACNIVARVLTEAGVHRGDEKAVEKVWQHYSRRGL